MNGPSAHPHTHPVAEGAVSPDVRVQTDRFDVGAELAALTAGRTDLGAVVSFTGICRDDGGRLAALELEHYPGMAEAEMTRVAAEAIARWPLRAVTIVHRAGRLEPGEQIVLVMAASEHRDAAFAGAGYIMDFLKTRAPFWKREHLADGSAGGWVSARDHDDRATERWRKA